LTELFITNDCYGSMLLVTIVVLFLEKWRELVNLMSAMFVL